MALVSGGTMRADRGRGQLLFVTALGLAALLVVLSVSLNAAVDTGRLGPDGTATDPTVNAVRFQQDTVAAVGGAIAHANADATEETTYSELDATVGDAVDEWRTLAGRQTALDGTWAQVGVSETVHGTRLAQTNDSRPVTSVDGTESWTLVTDTDRFRAFTLHLDAAELTTVHTASPSADQLATADVFTVILAGSSERARVFVYRNATAPIVAVESSDGSLETCVATAGPDGVVDLDLTDATTGRMGCGALESLAGMAGPYTVSYRDARSAVGTYSLVVDATHSDAPTAAYGVDGTTDPTATRAIYATTVVIEYDTPTLSSRVDRRVAPGAYDD